MDGERVDKAVAVLASTSRAVSRLWVEEGRVTVDGRAVEARMRVKEGAQLRIERPPPVELEAEEVRFEVRYLDEHVIVVDKPPGVVVHPGAGHERGTLAAGLLTRWPQLRSVGEENRGGIVHRLDRETSGLLMVARTQAAFEALREALSRRDVTRRYAALVWGAFEIPTGTIDAPIGRDPRHPTRFAVLPEGRSARTHYRRSAGWSQPGVTLLEVRLETGRTHQIRVHLASIGHPVVGDRVYGQGVPSVADPGRVWLHADRVEFTHPVSGSPIAVEAPLPDDLAGSLAALGEPD